MCSYHPKFCQIEIEANVSIDAGGECASKFTLV
jgi:hypothetical protein